MKEYCTYELLVGITAAVIGHYTGHVQCWLPSDWSRMPDVFPPVKRVVYNVSCNNSTQSQTNHSSHYTT